MNGASDTVKLRIDKWLWYARVVKTRSLATKLVQGGNVRVNREKISNASRGIKVDDVLTISVHERIRILKIVELGERRGPAKEAQLLYEDLSPQPTKKSSEEFAAAKTPSPNRRPDKKERRAIKSYKNSFT